MQGFVSAASPFRALLHAHVSERRKGKDRLVAQLTSRAGQMAQTPGIGRFGPLTIALM